ncbi:MAG: DUF1573 domain-containing protein [Ardenticatenales bacterium]
MSENRTRNRAAYGGPQDEKEVVVTIDRRVLLGVALIAVLGVALAVGVMAGRGAAPATLADASAGEGNAAAVATTDPYSSGKSDVELRATADALGLKGAQIVGGSDGEGIIRREPVAAATAAPGGLASAPDIVRDMATSMPDSAVEIDPSTVASDRLRDVVGAWPPDVLAGISDPNLAAEYRPFRVEDVTEPLTGGPRLAVQDLSPVWTYNFGDVKRDASVKRDFVVKNVGDKDLIIGRVYTGCGCTTTRIGDIPIDGAGNLPSPLTLKPGEQIPFTVEFDARLAHEQGSQAKFIQIFSNDDTKVVFDDAAPELTHETRFRIVVRPVDGAIEVPSDDVKHANEAGAGH